MPADWKLIPNDALSENGLMADKTMNTTLHLVEAYTELYRVCGDDRVLNRLKFQIGLFLDKIYYEPEHRLLVFFDRELNVIGDIHSYGHDIEATWLLDRACEVIGDDELTAKVREMNEPIVRNIADIAIENGAMINERENDKISHMHIWWMQAEGIVGFTNGWQKYGDRRYADIAAALWENVKAEFIDRREGGEWYSQILEDGRPDPAKPTVDPWKCPYHNGRMCLEIMKRA
jgi:mannobiose 2-epimerase